MRESFCQKKRTPPHGPAGVRNSLDSQGARQPAILSTSLDQWKILRTSVSLRANLRSAGRADNMKNFFSRNIDSKGRFARGLTAVALLAGGWFAFHRSAVLGLLLVISGGFTLFEALRGWCLLRACGVRTKL